MALIKSISGIRGTIGGAVGDNLTPLDIVNFTSAYCRLIKKFSKKEKLKIVIGRDARVSGEMVSHLVVGTLMGMGADVIDLGLTTTPTVEMAVPDYGADGGIILTASHNPMQWNALKLLNEKGEFISGDDAGELLDMAAKGDHLFNDVKEIGTYKEDSTYLQKHIDKILALPLVDVAAIKAAGLKVAIDCVNSTGGITLPQLLDALGVKEVIKLYCEPSGVFPHNPEPLPEHLTEISETVKKSKADVGFVVDPDVDRLAIITEKGDMFGEEYTLVAVADYILQHTPGSTVSNLSSTRALRVVTEKSGNTYMPAAVGEVNVVKMMKDTHAVIGGEGNGGVIYPELHYGRDALVGIALFLTHMAKSKLTCSALRATYPEYIISKNKIELSPAINVDKVLEAVKHKYEHLPVNTIDGVKIEFDNEWVHLRKSNTEPIIRIYAESESREAADKLAKQIMHDISLAASL